MTDPDVPHGRMELNELREHLARELDYPADAEAVRAAFGATEVAAPDDEDTETVGALLEAVNDGTYASADELFEAVLAQLPDDYIGRKFYDDRGGNGLDADPVREDRRDRSF